MNSTGTDICLIEDDGDERRLLTRRLESWDYSVIAAVDGDEGLRTIQRHRPRIVICDVMLPGLDGLQLCRRIRTDTELDGTYIVLVTAHDQSGRRQVALDAGADDYLSKPYDVRELQARIRCGMRYHHLHERLRHAALTDGLTGLWNHTYFREALAREYARARRYGGCVSLLMLDLDHFKSINDTYGHEVGNQILRATADVLREGLRECDLLARYGGEEFAIICPDTSIVNSTMLAERLRNVIRHRVRSEAHPDLVVCVSVGVAGTEDGRLEGVDMLIEMADKALYHSKRSGRDRVTRSDQIGENHAALPLETPADELDRLRKDIHLLSARSKDLCMQCAGALVEALETRDGYSAWHSRNVKRYTEWLADAAGWPLPLRCAAANAAFLHDLGKMGVPDELLLPVDADRVRDVPQITCRILAPLRVFETEIEMIRHLRERFDGSGYPDRLRGERIPIGSRLIAVAEAFDSLTCDRGHRPGRSIEDALEQLEAESGRQFDPAFIALLRSTIQRDEQRWIRQVQEARISMPLELAAGSAV